MAMSWQPHWCTVTKGANKTPTLKIQQHGGDGVTCILSVEGEKEGWSVFNPGNKIFFPAFTDLRRFRTYKGSHVWDLLRAMRNKVK